MMLKKLLIVDCQLQLGLSAGLFPGEGTLLLFLLGDCILFFNL